MHHHPDGGNQQRSRQLELKADAQTGVQQQQQARDGARADMPGTLDLLRGDVLRTTVFTVIVCACSLTGWWAFLFWNHQHFGNLPELQGWKSNPQKQS